MDSGQWTVDSGQWTVDSGQLTADSGQLTVDSGQWTVDSGQWTVQVDGVRVAEVDRARAGRWQGGVSGVGRVAGLFRRGTGASGRDGSASLCGDGSAPPPGSDGSARGPALSCFPAPGPLRSGPGTPGTDRRPERKRWAAVG